MMRCGRFATFRRLRVVFLDFLCHGICHDICIVLVSAAREHFYLRPRRESL
jgi:hypothetical protein